MGNLTFFETQFCRAALSHDVGHKVRQFDSPHLHTLSNLTNSTVAPPFSSVNLSISTSAKAAAFSLHMSQWRFQITCPFLLIIVPRFVMSGHMSPIWLKTLDLLHYRHTTSQEPGWKCSDKQGWIDRDLSLTHDYQKLLILRVLSKIENYGRLLSSSKFLTFLGWNRRHSTKAMPILPSRKFLSSP